MNESTQTPTSPDFFTNASWTNLVRRAEILNQIRRFFTGHGFLEIETPLLSRDTVVDRYIDPFVCEGRYLQTSPEFAMKRLLASDIPDSIRGIWQLCRAFRHEESGALHNPEFTILEWYHRDHDMEKGIRFLSDLAELLFHRGPAEVIRYVEIFETRWGLDPHQGTPAELRCLADRERIAYPEEYAQRTDAMNTDVSTDTLRSPEAISLRDLWLDLLLSEKIQPELGRERPVILTEYPASQAALARTTIDAAGRSVAERFELYYRGIELANGYHELLDAMELRRRNYRNNAMRRADGRMELPVESQLLAAMESGMPATTGCAMGIDRAVMLACGAERMDECMAFRWDRA
ncbi:MAG: EF-P lysine aminoacylase EpmA [Planctomycetia bacterium]|nr:EF-P lysine aminoacylase EpmA [Planctomycetia bacterium]